ncbi:MAG TPA: nucleotide pyrophosphohydrolase [Bacteroidales bacterium]|nr:nucleotide pyrophosphohydrolase [Bacteroidales bacterium]
MDEILKMLDDFRSSRNWKQFHNPKNLAISTSIEANELLEIFQWKNFDESTKALVEQKAEISNEIADIAIYLLYLCQDADIDFIESIKNKIRINEIRYPVEKSKNNATKYNQL